MDTRNKEHQSPIQAFSGDYVFNDLLSTNERQYLVEHGQIRSLIAGDTLCRQNEIEDSIFVLLTGEVAIVEDIDDQTIELGKLHKGDIVGEIGALFSVPRIATVVATKPSVVLRVSGNSFSYLLNKTPILQNAVYQRLYERSLKTALKSMPTFTKYHNLEETPELSRVLQCWNSNKVN